MVPPFFSCKKFSFEKTQKVDELVVVRAWVAFPRVRVISTIFVEYSNILFGRIQRKDPMLTFNVDTYKRTAVFTIYSSASKEPRIRVSVAKRC